VFVGEREVDSRVVTIKVILSFVGYVLRPADRDAVLCQRRSRTHTSRDAVSPSFSPGTRMPSTVNQASICREQENDCHSLI
jgi:hypothetical protein